MSNVPCPDAEPTHLALQRLPLVRDYLDAFHAATGIRLRFLSAAACFPVATLEPEVALLAAPVVVGGRHVSTFVSEPLTLPAHQVRGLERLLAIFARHLSEFSNRQFLAPRNGEPSCVARAREFVEENFRGDITARTVANKIQISPRHFSKVFRRATGMTFAEYLARYRVEKARALLADGDRRMSEVAVEAGFQSVAQFSRAFRRYAGMNPGACRKAMWDGRSSADRTRVAVACRRQPPTLFRNRGNQTQDNRTG